MTKRASRCGIVVALAVAAAAASCGRGPSTPPRRGAPEASPRARDGGGADETPDAAAPGRDADAGAGAARGAGDAAVATGLRGRVVPVEGAPAGTVLVVVPGTSDVRAAAPVGPDGAFAARVPPATYRLVVPADGVHATADLYAEVAPDAGLVEVDVHRSRGCPVTVTVRAADGHLIAGAALELTLTDLPQVARRHVARVTTGADGRAVVVGSCVRGFLEGRVEAPGRGDFAVRHGYVGTGRDRFDVVLPDAPDAGVTYENDD